MSDEQAVKVERLDTVANSVPHLVDFMAARISEGDVTFLAVVGMTREGKAIVAASGLAGLLSSDGLTAIGALSRLQRMIHEYLDEIEVDVDISDVLNGDETEEPEDEDEEDNIVSFRGKKGNGKAPG